jgi:hypothetical protein
VGAWSASVNGNDTAQDLLPEYSAAFYKYPVEEALEKLDAYVRAEGFDESDPEEWVNYYYSLADFLWKKGILPDRIRDRAVEMIDTLVPGYMKEGKYSLSIGVGCTGGHHRSVAIANEMYSRLKEKGHRVMIEHRDL